MRAVGPCRKWGQGWKSVAGRDCSWWSARPMGAVSKQGFGSTSGEADQLMKLSNISSGWHSSAFISRVQVCALSAQSHDCLCLLLCSSYSCMQHYFNVDAIQRPVSSLQAQLPPKSTYKRGLVHKILVHLSSGNVGSVIPMLLAIACRKVWNMWMFTIANIAFKTKRIELIRKPIGRGKIGCVRNRVNVLA